MNMIFGEFTLTLSLLCYLVWFLPQLILNAKRKSTSGLSFMMHTLLFIGYLEDFIYAVGTHIQWQYILVTLSGIICLSYQHYQIGTYNIKSKIQIWEYKIVTNVLVCIAIYAMYVCFFSSKTQHYYDLSGMVANACWITYAIPQIIINYRAKSCSGLSIWFVVLSILTGSLDNLSAWSLNWDYPSLVGLPFSVLKNVIFLWQFYYYSVGRLSRSGRLNEQVQPT